MIALLGLYRRIPVLPAFALAVFGAAIVTISVTVAGVFTISKILNHFSQSDLGTGILVVMAVPNIIVPSFVVALTFLFNLHGRASWKTPTLGFVVGATATWIWTGPFDLRFAPLALGTGVLAWGMSCLMLHRKGVPQHGVL